jgi:hypothetical protein
MFYKNIAERLEYKQQNDVESLNSQLFRLQELEKDYKIKIEELERDNEDLTQ